MGAFDDLIPQASQPSARSPAAQAGGGMFADLIPGARAADADVPQIDFDRPIEDVRADFAKMPEGPQRDAAYKAWAEHYVTKERAGSDTGIAGGINRAFGIPGGASDFARNVARGTLIGSFADEMDAGTQAILHRITGGRAGAPYDEAVAYQRALDRAIDKESPVGSAVAQVGGALSSGAVLAKGVYKGAEALLPRVLAAPAAGAVVGPTVGYVSGAGSAEGDFAKRHERATSPGPLGLSPVELGLALGVGLPPVIQGVGAIGNKLADVAGPTVARYGAELRRLPERIGLPRLSADGAVPENVGANAAAAQMLANSLRRSGKTAEGIRAAQQAASEAGVFHSSGNAQNATFLGDLDEGWQRLAGSAARMNPGAAEVGKQAIYAKQTGITPHNALAGDVAETVGLPTAPMFARPTSAPQALKKFGTDFGAGGENVVPMGQGQRIVDALKRAFRIRDTDFHGHAANASRTDEAILAAARAEAKPAYAELYKAGDNISVAPEVGAVVSKWQPDGEKLGREAPPVVAMVQRWARMFAPNGNPVAHIEKFDRIKQYMDGQIEKLVDSPIGRNRHAAGVLTEFKNELLAAVDGVKKNGLGSKYSEARAKFSSAMESREALQAGREAINDPESGLRVLEGLRANEDDVRVKLFRLGILGDVERRAGAMKRGADKTQIFDNENIQRLLSEAIPRSKGTGKFATRPETFGQYIGNEQRGVATRNIFQGGSPTPRNLKDDDAYDVLSRWGEMMQGFKSTGSLTKLGIDLVANTFQSVFGMRADTARAIVRQLFTADPNTQNRILQEVASRMEPGQFEKLTQYVAEQQAALTHAAAQQAARP